MTEREVILDGRQPADLTLDKLLEDMPLDWTAQVDGLEIFKGHTSKLERGRSAGGHAKEVSRHCPLN